MTTHIQLKWLAAMTWYLGGTILLLKARSLLSESTLIEPESSAFIWSMVCGLSIGLLKARYLFNKSCRHNLARIQQLQQPRLWQFFRPRFFLFLVLMVLLGTLLSRMAHGNFNLLIGVATLDLSLATALFTSGTLFWIDEKR
ncbi:MAG: hypothetical protein HOI61_08650 [Gammaproteobacteria bacterium]|jgi:hypothetical protein|nr:hypothetical protein [Gammaproteobacteria bacterium]MBT3718674.1 hypothetical protein [Gammaproteobacteria bacterium]MBT3844746.1 hypothetical protein [Gammaproteobacteria bacterium]MBT3893858.1 hypothetical protein [Gammaproteobacteria bacterium]MBT4300558.1 hypothetical protein [Gammaproteobacteria bacterium]